MLDRLPWLDLQGHLNTVCQLTILAILIFPKVCKTELLSLLASLVFIDDSSNGLLHLLLIKGQLFKLIKVQLKKWS